MSENPVQHDRTKHVEWKLIDTFYQGEHQKWSCGVKHLFDLKINWQIFTSKQSMREILSMYLAS